jgi:hypothetical protein
MISINRSTRRTFISNGLAVSGALAFGAPGACFAAAEAQTKQSGGPASNPAAATQITGPGSLKAHARAKSLLFGAAVEAQLLSTNAEVAQIVMDQCSILVAENSMKMGPMRPTPTTYSFEAGDALVAFGVQCHGNQGQRASTAGRPHLDCCRAL